MNSINSIINNNNSTYFITDRLILNELCNKAKAKKDSPMNIAVKDNWHYAVIILDEEIKRNPNFWKDNNFNIFKGMYDYDQYFISWFHVEIAMNNKNYEMVKLLCSRMSTEYSSLTNLVDTQRYAIGSIIKKVISMFDIELIEYLVSVGLPILSEINYHSMTIAMMNNTKAIDFYSVKFTNNDFLESLLYGCDNTLKWMEEYQPDICYVSNPKMFFEYPYGQNLFELVDNNNVEGVKYYFKYLGNHIHPIIIKRLLDKSDNFEIIEFLTTERLSKFQF